VLVRDAPVRRRLFAAGTPSSPRARSRSRSQSDSRRRSVLLDLGDGTPSRRPSDTLSADREEVLNLDSVPVTPVAAPSTARRVLGLATPVATLAAGALGAAAY
jgi:hypothetical protein